MPASATAPAPALDVVPPAEIRLYGFSPQVVVTHEERASNAQLVSYDRTHGELRFVRQF